MLLFPASRKRFVYESLIVWFKVYNQGSSIIVRFSIITLLHTQTHTQSKSSTDIVSHCQVVILVFLFQFAWPTSLPLAVPPAVCLLI